VIYSPGDHDSAGNFILFSQIIGGFMKEIGMLVLAGSGDFDDFNCRYLSNAIFNTSY
jgi:hypothetical protein